MDLVEELHSGPCPYEAFQQVFPREMRAAHIVALNYPDESLEISTDRESQCFYLRLRHRCTIGPSAPAMLPARRLVTIGLGGLRQTGSQRLRIRVVYSTVCLLGNKLEKRQQNQLIAAPLLPVNDS